jgi:hypothetical protein
MHDQPYDSEEEADARLAQEVTTEHKDFVDEILEGSSDATHSTTDNLQVISRDSNTISG